MTWLDDNPIHIESNHGSLGSPDWADEVDAQGNVRGDDGNIILWRNGEEFFGSNQHLTIGVEEIEEVIALLRVARNRIRQEQGKARAK